MVANAGIGKLLSLVDMTVDVWDSMMCVNVRSTMLAYKHAARQMIQQGRGGRIIGGFIEPVVLRFFRAVLFTFRRSPRRCSVHGGEER